MQSLVCIFLTRWDFALPLLYPRVVQILLDDELEELSEGNWNHAKLAQAVVQRWVSTAKMMFRILEQFTAIQKCFVEKGKVFPLANYKTEVGWCSTLTSFPQGELLHSCTMYQTLLLVCRCPLPRLVGNKHGYVLMRLGNYSTNRCDDGLGFKMVPLSSLAGPTQMLALCIDMFCIARVSYVRVYLP